jgi:hypothetical protein
MFYRSLCIDPFNNTIFLNTELLKGAEEGNIDDVTSWLMNGVDIESKDKVRITHLFDTYAHA